ncbi:hypothetical protein HDU80_008119 [Chytriomyces hyalinus]|nr:hypothetical protein HDU80_008119 [Chytriomyces hyalinus]
MVQLGTGDTDPDFKSKGGNNTAFTAPSRQKILRRNAVVLLLVAVVLIVGFGAPAHTSTNGEKRVEIGPSKNANAELLKLKVESQVDGAVASALGEVLRKLETVDKVPDDETENETIDLDKLQANVLDHLNGEEGKWNAEDSHLFGGSLRSFQQDAFPVKSSYTQALAHAQTHANTAKPNATDFRLLGQRTRSLLIAYSLLHDHPSLIPLVGTDKTKLSAIVEALTESQYPWLKPTFKSLREMQLHYRNTQDKQGIVICSGKWHFELAVHAITSFRRVLNSTLPVEVHYAGEKDLEPAMVRALNQMQNVRAVNILEAFPDETKNWGGWSIKPFAMMASRFRNVIFVDADALFFQDPEVTGFIDNQNNDELTCAIQVLLSKSAIFKEYGSLFYHDRTLGRDDPATWFKSINPEWSHYASTLRYMRGLSKHEMESGVVVVDKARTGPLHAMMLVCKLNSRVERDAVTYRNMHGDKETYWIAFEMARVPYKFTPSYGGTVGYKNPDNGRVCGGLFHTDEYLKPLWWNGGVVANKHASQDAGFMKFEHAAFDLEGGSKIQWDWETPTTPFCLGPTNPAREVVALSNDEKEMGRKFVELYQRIKGKWKDYFRNVYGMDVDTGDIVGAGQDDEFSASKADSDKFEVFMSSSVDGLDLAQTQFLDYLNGEEGASGENMFQLTNCLLQTWKKIHAFSLATHSAEYNRTDFREMGRRARSLRIADTLLHDRKDLRDRLSNESISIFINASDPKPKQLEVLREQLELIVEKLTVLMYPWLTKSRFKSLHGLQSHFRRVPKEDEVGIILSTGRGHFELALHAIVSFRTVLKCDLPVEVHHMGPNDLGEEMTKAFNSLPGVKTVDVYDYWGEEAQALGGWAIKPFALLASRFQKVMFIDADAVFIQSPEVLFTKSEIFSKYGQLFYHDRTITGHDWCYNWFNGFVPHISKYTNSLRFQKKHTVHEQESGVVLVDKGRTDVLHGLLTTAKMNMKYERDGMTYKLMHGDKESYWMSWELARVPYKFSVSYGGTIGYKNDKNAVCGGLFHTDEYLKPLWWNGGVLANKHFKKSGEGILNYEFAAYDNEGKDIEWEWETATTPFCLKPKFEGQKVVVSELNDEEKRVGRELVELYRDIVSDGWKAFMKRKYSVVV